MTALDIARDEWDYLTWSEEVDDLGDYLMGRDEGGDLVRVGGGQIEHVDRSNPDPRLWYWTQPDEVTDLRAALRELRRRIG